MPLTWLLMHLIRLPASEHEDRGGARNPDCRVDAIEWRAVAHTFGRDERAVGDSHDRKGAGEHQPPARLHGGRVGAASQDAGDDGEKAKAFPRHTRYCGPAMWLMSGSITPMARTSPPLHSMLQRWTGAKSDDRSRIGGHSTSEVFSMIGLRRASPRWMFIFTADEGEPDLA